MHIETDLPKKDKNAAAVAIDRRPRIVKGNIPANKLRVRIPWLLEVESDGLIPVLGAFLLCAMMIVWLALK